MAERRAQDFHVSLSYQSCVSFSRLLEQHSHSYMIKMAIYIDLVGLLILLSVAEYFSIDRCEIKLYLPVWLETLQTMNVI